MAHRNPATNLVEVNDLIRLINDSPNRRQLVRDFMSMFAYQAHYTDSMDHFTSRVGPHSPADHRDNGSLQLHYDADGNCTQGFIFEPRLTDGTEPDYDEHFTGSDVIAHALDYLHG